MHDLYCLVCRWCDRCIAIAGKKGINAIVALKKFNFGKSLLNAAKAGAGCEMCDAVCACYASAMRECECVVSMHVDGVCT
jgi:hypothetical protein